MKKLLKITFTLIFTTIILLGFAMPLNPVGNWYQQFMPVSASGQIRDIYFVDSLLGFAVSDSSILKTTNGGDNWVVKSNGFNNFRRITFLNTNTGFACAGNNRLFKTINSGENWTFIVPSGIFPFDMAVLNVDTIWLVDNNSFAGGVFLTTNGGANWQNQFSSGNQNPNKIYMYNARIGYMSNSSALPNIYKTTNSGLNWILNLPGENFTDMYFIDSLTGWKANGNMKKTTNGGLNWVNQVLPQGGNIWISQITKFTNINKDTIFGVGGTVFYGAGQFRGMIFRTENGGDNWTFQVPDTSIHIAQYSFIKFVNKNTGWAYTGSPGIHTTNGGDPVWLTAVEQTSTVIPKEYKLYQNYPNPFNPRTVIPYSIKRSAFVKLTAYDILGRETQKLVDSHHNAGEYEVDFMGKFSASGVYFYRIEITDDASKQLFTETKKMMLIK